MNNRIIEEVAVAGLAVPLNTTGAVVASPWLSLANYRRCLFIIQQGAWAAGTPAVTLLQAKDASGGSAKALAFDTMFAASLTVDVPVTTAVVANTFNLPNVLNSISMIEIHQQDLDCTNGFSFVQLNIASPGANADLIAAFAILGDPKWAGKPDTRPSVLA